MNKFLTIIALAATTAAVAEVKTASWIADGMVLQRNQPIVLCGTADAGEVVEIVLDKKKFSTAATETGTWSIELPAQNPKKKGRTTQLTIAGRAIENVLVGDVFLCSGQSNMELPISRVREMFEQEISTFASDEIRILTVPKTFNFAAPQDDFVGAKWQAIEPANVNNVSAICYFFAKKLVAQTGVPVGIVNASWGGTPIEAWMSEEAISEFPLALAEKKLYENDDYRASIKRTEGMAYHAWNTTLYASDPGKQSATQWSADVVDCADWTTCQMPGQLPIVLPENYAEAANVGRSKAGSHWLRKTFDAPVEVAGKQAVIRLGCIVDADSVWVNGVYVGSTGYMYPPRIYTIPAGVLREGQNNVTVRIVSNGARPELVVEKPYKIIADDVEIALDGQWFYRRGAVMPQAPSMMFFCYKPVCLYNAMIAPLRAMKFAAAVWYQGETNVGREVEYAHLFRAMADDWRRTFSQSELPIYVIELAKYLADDDLDQPAWMRFRDMQRQLPERVEGVHTIENRDLGEWNDIHPLDKKTVAERLATSVRENLK